MTGYQEILTDPSYEGQLVAMTYPEIGNVGVNREDVESRRPYVRGFVVREYREAPSSWRAEESPGAYLARDGVPAIEGLDPPALVRHLRDHGPPVAVGTGLHDGGAGRRAAAREGLRRRRLRLRHQVQHPAEPGWDGLPRARRPRVHERRRGAGDASRRRLPLQRPRRPGRGRGRAG